MNRITFSLEPEMEKILEELQHKLEQKDGKNWSVSKIINMVILGGIVGSKEITVHGWGIIRSYLDGKPFKLHEGVIEEYLLSLMALKQIA